MNRIVRSRAHCACAHFGQHAVAPSRSISAASAKAIFPESANSVLHAVSRQCSSMPRPSCVVRVRRRWAVADGSAGCDAAERQRETDPDGAHRRAAAASDLEHTSFALPFAGNDEATNDVRQNGSSISGYPVTAALTPTSTGYSSTLASTSCVISLTLAPGSYTLYWHCGG